MKHFRKFSICFTFFNALCAFSESILEGFGKKLTQNDAIWLWKTLITNFEKIVFFESCDGSRMPENILGKIRILFEKFLDFLFFHHFFDIFCKDFECLSHKAPQMARFFEKIKNKKGNNDYCRPLITLIKLSKVTIQAPFQIHAFLFSKLGYLDSKVWLTLLKIENGWYYFFHFPPVLPVRKILKLSTGTGLFRAIWIKTLYFPILIWSLITRVLNASGQ